MIYHVVNNLRWKTALQMGVYEAESLATEGFIHASKGEQLENVLERYYKGQKDLMLLHIDEIQLTAPLRYEMAPSVNQKFPHIYGPLNLDAVVKAEQLG